jgi:hypothetical protein
MKTMISVNRVEANRRNARKSTGPKSAGGKAMSKMNAFKHGLLAREVVVPGFGLNAGEHESKFQALHQMYREHLEPVGPLEEMMVERIVTAYWRLHRVLIAERGEILRSLEEAKQVNPVMDPRRLLSTLGRLPWADDAAREVNDVRNSVRKGGELTEPMLARLLKVLEGRSSMITRLQEAQEVPPTDAEGLSAEALKAKRQERLLKFLDEQLVCCEAGLHEIGELHVWNKQVRRDASLMPAQKIVEKLLRYEARLERQMYRAMNQLERLQRLRRGEVVPPPVVIQAS